MTEIVFRVQPDEWLPVAELMQRFHPANSQQRSAEEMAAIRRSIEAEGFTAEMIVLNPENGLIVSGHGRTQACWDLGYRGTLPVVHRRYATDAEHRRAMLRFNLARGHQDPEQQAAEFEALLTEFDEEGLAADFALTDQEFDDLMAEWGTRPEPPAAPEPQIDRAEELRQKWGVEPGQLWRLGAHRLICGDCTDAAVVERLLQGDVPLLMVTDPPYGVNYDPNWRNEAAEKGLLAYAARRIGEVPNDDRTDWSEAYQLFPGDVAYTWSPPGDLLIDFGQALISAGFGIRNMLIWKKPHFPISRGHYTYQHEPCWYAVRKGKKSFWCGDNNASTVWDISLDKNVQGGHSTQKPLECMARPIRNHESELVYEPFLGSGTTLIACEQLGRQCRAVEISPAYVAVALERWHEMTGETPELAGA